MSQRYVKKQANKTTGMIIALFFCCKLTTKDYDIKTQVGEWPFISWHGDRCISFNNYHMVPDNKYKKKISFNVICIKLQKYRQPNKNIQRHSVKHSFFEKKFLFGTSCFFWYIYPFQCAQCLSGFHQCLIISATYNRAHHRIIRLTSCTPLPE